MKDVLPDWLEDPSAFAQPANLDMSTVLLVAGGNLFVGFICVTIFEVSNSRGQLPQPRSGVSAAIS